MRAKVVVTDIFEEYSLRIVISADIPRAVKRRFSSKNPCTMSSLLTEHSHNSGKFQERMYKSS